MGRTFAEKVLGKAAGYALKAGDVVKVIRKDDKWLAVA